MFQAALVPSDDANRLLSDRHGLTEKLPLRLDPGQSQTARARYGRNHPDFFTNRVSSFSLTWHSFHFLCHPTPQTSIFPALNAFDSMKRPTRLHIIPHERGENPISRNSILNLHSKQPSHSRIHRSLPKLPRIHLTETFIALLGNIPLSISNQPLHSTLEVINGHTPLTALDHSARANQPLKRQRRSQQAADSPRSTETLHPEQKSSDSRDASATPSMTGAPAPGHT